MDIGNHLRLKKARKELKALNKVPQSKYLMVSGEAASINPSRNIEEANILFQDGEVYRSSFSIIKKKLN